MNPSPEIQASQIVQLCSGQAPEKLTASASENALHVLLLDGPRDSREVLAAMANQGLSPKQVRRAREKMGVVVERQGNGAAMRTTWRLPELAIRAHDDAAVSTKAVSTKVSTKIPLSSSVREVVRSQTPDWTAAPTAANHEVNGRWSEAERSRHAGRVEAFANRGIKLDVARQVSDLLVVSDRENRHAYGSCAQCASLNTPECSVPRPVVELHVCCLRRCAVN